MTIYDLFRIIRKYGVDEGEGYYSILGSDLLEHVEDIEGFVSLLGGLKRVHFPQGITTSFIDDNPNPIEFILEGDVRFCANKYCIVGAYVVDGNFTYWGNKCDS